MMPRMVDLRLFSDGMIIREGISHPVCVHTGSFMRYFGREAFSAFVSSYIISYAFFDTTGISKGG